MSAAGACACCDRSVACPFPLGKNKASQSGRRDLGGGGSSSSSIPSSEGACGATSSLTCLHDGMLARIRRSAATNAVAHRCLHGPSFSNAGQEHESTSVLPSIP